MNGELRIVVVAGTDDQALPPLWELRRSGRRVAFEQVSSRSALESVLTRDAWDVVLGTYSAPELDVPEALALVRRRDADLPFLVLSDRTDEAAAVAALTAGADDYVSIGDLSRLPAAVERACRLARSRAHRSRAEREAHDRLGRLEAMAANVPGMLCRLVRDAAGTLRFDFVGDGSRALLGLAPADLLHDAAAFVERIAVDDRAAFDRELALSAATLVDMDWDGRIESDGHGQPGWVNVRARPRRLDDGAVVWDGIVTDIARRKQAEIALAQTRGQLSELAGNFQRLRERERESLTRTIRDEIGGNLAAIKMSLSWLSSSGSGKQQAGDLERGTESLIDRTIEATNRIASSLRPSMLDVGLGAAIEWEIDEFRKQGGIACSFTGAEIETGLSQDAVVAAFRVVEEALANVRHHARASRVDVALSRAHGLVKLEITDDGRGIVDGDLDRPGVFGLRAMVELAASLGGSLDVLGLDGRGTRVLLYLPASCPGGGTAVQEGAGAMAGETR